MAAGAGKRRPAALGSTGAVLIKTSTEAAAAGAAMIAATHRRCQSTVWMDPKLKLLIMLSCLKIHLFNVW
jgi:hypothetical protein